MEKLFIMLLLGVFLSVSSGYGRSMVDSLTQQHKQILLAEMGSLIKEYAFFHGGTMVWRYDCWADTTGNFRLYLAEQVAVLGDRTLPGMVPH